MGPPPPSPPLPGYAGAYAHFLVTSPAPFVAHVEINRPEKLNAFTRAMWLELRALFRRLSADPDVRAVVLSGAGDRAFTAGLDVQAAAASEPTLQGSGEVGGGPRLDVARAATVRRRDLVEFQECIWTVEKCEKRMSFFFFPNGLPPSGGRHVLQTCLKRAMAGRLAGWLAG